MALKRPRRPGPWIVDEHLRGLERGFPAKPRFEQFVHPALPFQIRVKDLGLHQRPHRRVPAQQRHGCLRVRHALLARRHLGG